MAGLRTSDEAAYHDIGLDRPQHYCQDVYMTTICIDYYLIRKAQPFMLRAY
jgi:hypothetical protein